jgi:hypothetical protein
LADALPICVPPALVPQVWPHVADMLQRVFDKTDFGQMAYLKTEVFEGRALLWVVAQDEKFIACVVTQIRDDEYSKTCYLMAAAGGQHRKWTHMMVNIETYARDMGCNKIRATGRKGWTRVLPDFRPTLVVFEKDLA